MKRTVDIYLLMNELGLSQEQKEELLRGIEKIGAEEAKK